MYFSIIEPMLIALVLFIVYYNIGEIKNYRKRCIIFGVSAVIANTLLAYFEISSLAIFINALLIIVFEYFNCRKKYQAIIISVIYIGTMIIADMACGYIVMAVFGFSDVQIRHVEQANFILYMVGIIVSICVSKIMSIALNAKKLDVKDMKLNKLLYGYIIITGLVMYLNVTILGIYIESLSMDVTALLIAIFVLYCLLGLAFLYMMNQNYKKSLELELKQQENERLTGYANLLEKQHEDMRIFKHDYMNILATISGYIQLKDMNKLDEYFKDKILNQGDVFKEDNNVKIIKKIESIPIRGMLYAKLIKAQKLDVTLNIDILQDIPLFAMNEIDVCKILGILIDNAIEATSSLEEKVISLTMECIQGEIRVNISNPFDGAIEDISLLYKKGYSTKGEGRGLGLHTVKMLIDNKKSNAKLATNIKNSMFIQELIFPIKVSEI